MRLKPLLEADGEGRVRQFALHLQQALLERFDQLDVDLESVDATPNGWSLLMTPVFERYPDYQPKIDVCTTLSSPGTGCLVGISRRQGLEYDKDHVYLRTGTPGASGALWENPSDPELLEALEEKFLLDIAKMVGSDVNKRVKTSVWDVAEKTDFTPFDYSIPNYLLTDDKTGVAIGKATLDGLHVRCTAIPVRKKNPIGSAKAGNDFNDNVLRKQPKPRQILVKTDSSADVTFFIYATHEAPPTA